MGQRLALVLFQNFIVIHTRICFFNAICVKVEQFEALCMRIEEKVPEEDDDIKRLLLDAFRRLDGNQAFHMINSRLNKQAELG